MALFYCVISLLLLYTWNLEGRKFQKLLIIYINFLTIEKSQLHTILKISILLYSTRSRMCAIELLNKKNLILGKRNKFKKNKLKNRLVIISKIPMIVYWKKL